MAVREHVAEVSLLRGLAGHQGQVLGDGLQAARPLPGPEVHWLRVGLGLAVESDILPTPRDHGLGLAGDHGGEEDTQAGRSLCSPDLKMVKTVLKNCQKLSEIVRNYQKLTSFWTIHLRSEL